MPYITLLCACGDMNETQSYAVRVSLSIAAGAVGAFIGVSVAVTAPYSSLFSPQIHLTHTVVPSKHVRAADCDLQTQNTPACG
ncbi:hypothetical protein HYPSUDRAFT_288625 [Hypholoma sublateritium FD-334 SS-4]|uniref:Uncharacterized protein n=1 Tax=Hypholoma sublateritium (strain FD-334 SS-4) TaxID=945553 RepID=A0A0D2NIW2_HYPSF|nr:hypothetical protein HYPSUDRAFT_288625 [Hypholoma sublateritium FD-334 SS-4]